MSILSVLFCHFFLLILFFYLRIKAGMLNLYLPRRWLCATLVRTPSVRVSFENQILYLELFYLSVIPFWRILFQTRQAPTKGNTLNRHVALKQDYTSLFVFFIFIKRPGISALPFTSQTQTLSLHSFVLIFGYSDLTHKSRCLTRGVLILLRFFCFFFVMNMYVPLCMLLHCVCCVWMFWKLTVALHFFLSL